MLVNKIMQVLKNLFGLNKKIASSEIAIKNEKDNSANTLDTYLSAKTIYDSGDNENGSWIRYNDGTMICRNTKGFDVTTPNSLGAGLYYGYIGDIGDFPQEFIEKPDVTFTHHTGTDIFAIQPYDITRITTTNAGGVYPISTNSRTSAVTIYVTYIAIGKWK